MLQPVGLKLEDIVDPEDEEKLYAIRLLDTF